MARISDPETYYDEHGDEEWKRLDSSFHGRLEWEGTVDLLEEHLPPEGRVLDVGGGAGRYTVWLAERGYEVTLVDPSEGQRTVAQKHVTERGLEDTVTIKNGDIRDLAFDSKRFDATLCLGGPLSHVLDADERGTAVQELKRVTSSDGPIFISVMGLLNLLTILLASTKKLDVMVELADSGDYNDEVLGDHDSEFTETHFFRATEFESLLNDAGLTVDSLIGLEGLASIYTPMRLRETAAELSDTEREMIRQLVRQQRNDRTVVDMSAHMLAICRTGE